MNDRERAFLYGIAAGLIVYALAIHGADFAKADAGLTAAVAYVGTTGVIGINPGCPGLTVPALPAGVTVTYQSGGTETKYGRVSFGTLSGADRDYDQSGAGGSGSTFRDILDIRETLTDFSKVYAMGGFIQLFANPSIAPVSALYGLTGEVYTTAGNAQNFPRIEGHDFATFHRGSGTVTGLVGGTHTAYIGYPTGGGPVTLAQGARNKVSNYSASTVADARGSDNRANNHGVGTLTNAYATYSKITNNAGGVITNAYGTYVATPDTVGQGVGSITNSYGLYLENQNVGGTRYSIFSNGGTSRFVGAVELPGGISGTVTTNNLLTAAGGILLTGDPGGSAGALRWATNRVTINSGTSGFAINSSDNTRTTMLVDDGGRLELTGATAATTPLLIVGPASATAPYSQWRSSAGDTLWSIKPGRTAGNAVAHLKSGQSVAPTIAAGAALGTAPTVAVRAGGTDAAGMVELTAGTSPTTGVAATVTFRSPYFTAPKCVVLGNARTGSAARQAYVSSTTTTTFVISFDVAPTASTRYDFYYWIVE